MAATTISRATITDGVTVVSSAQMGTDFYDKVDALFTSAFTFGDLVHAEGFGDHLFSAGGTGGNTIVIRNTTAGTSNLASVELGNDADADVGRLEAYASSYTEAGAAKQNGVALRSVGAGGVSIAAEHASGDVRLYANGTTKIATFDGDRLQAAGSAQGSWSASHTLTDSVDTVQNANAGSGDEDLYTFSLPANTLAVNGQAVRFLCWGTTANNTDNKTLSVLFGSTTMQSVGASAWDNRTWIFEALILRTGAANQDYIVRGTAQGGGMLNAFGTATETLSGAINLIFRANGTNASDISFEGALVQVVN